jgi:phosphopentomutase
MKRFIVIVLDGFGVGQMEDVPTVRPADMGANTFLHILREFPDLRLPTLERLGLMNVVDLDSGNMHRNPAATWGKAKLMHHGADTFFGHQEIVGTFPRKAFAEPIRNKLEAIHDLLCRNGYDVRYHEGTKERFLVVNDAVTVADNIECDPGQAFNVTATLDKISFEEEVKIGRLVRSLAKVPRVITFGGRNVPMEDILNAVEEHENGYIGINAPASGVYREDYHCIHMGYGVDPDVQVPSILGKAGIPVYLLGKAADVIQNPYGTSISLVPTAKVLETLCQVVSENEKAFFCCNVQETDLAGHQENARLYADVLRTADAGIKSLLPLLSGEDILVVMADHGNDPTIGHPHHTREYVPLMVAGPRVKQCTIGIRNTLSDVGATAAAYFGAGKPENGTDFLSEITKD